MYTAEQSKVAAEGVLHEHGFSTRRVGDTLEAGVRFTVTEDDVIVPGFTWERVPFSSPRAVREWLGY